MADFYFAAIFEVGDVVTFTRNFDAPNSAWRKKNREYLHVFRGDEGTVVDVEQGSYAVPTNKYTIRHTRTGVTIGSVQEFLIE